MKKHWANFLSSGIGGTLLYRVSDIQDKTVELQTLQLKIKRVEREMAELEDDILTEVKKDWTTGEIIEAREKAISAI